MKHLLLLSSLLLITLPACDDAKKADAEKGEAKKDDAKKDDAKKEEGDTKEAADSGEAAPGCSAVVDHIASFNEGSGDAEKKLWGKMCDEMNDAQKTCVSKASDMDGMKACMKDKGDEKLEK